MIMVGRNGFIEGANSEAGWFNVCFPTPAVEGRSDGRHTNMADFRR